MPDWKGEYREQKERSGKTWDEFVRTELYHEYEIRSLAGVVEDLLEQTEALETEVRELRHELAEVRMLSDSEVGDE